MKRLNTTQPEGIHALLDAASRTSKFSKSELVRLGVALLFMLGGHVVSKHTLRKAQKNLITILDGHRVVRGRPRNKRKRG